MKKVYIVEDQSNRGLPKVFLTKASAIEYMETLIGKKHAEWEEEDYDYAEDTDDMVFYTEGELMEEE